MGRTKRSIIYIHTHPLLKVNKSRKPRGLKLFNLPFWSTRKTIFISLKLQKSEDQRSFQNWKYLVLGYNHHSWSQYIDPKDLFVFIEGLTQRKWHVNQLVEDVLIWTAHILILKQMKIMDLWVQQTQKLWTLEKMFPIAVDYF